MRLGLDFDNTIVNYDTLFHKVAEEQGHIPSGLTRTKLAVRDYLRAQNREEVWTEMQGYVYGTRMMEASAFDGVVDYLNWARNTDIEISIVSHKTKHPFIGPRYDLHGVAREWVQKHLSNNGKPLVDDNKVFYELTKDEKIARIASSNFSFFVDDLPEIFTAETFPSGTKPILFDPAGCATLPPRAVRITDWASLRRLTETECRK